jgi:hypothetical protein
VLVVASTEHRGYRHLIIRKPNGAKTLLPEWMTTAEAGAIQTVSSPRLSINKLLELRAFLDRLMTSSEDQPSGGVNDETLETTRTRSVQDTAVKQLDATSTKTSNRATQNATQRSDAGRRRGKSKHRSSGGKR